MVKIVQADRVVLYKILAIYFNSIKVEPKICEVGVHRGVNALALQNILKPKEMYLFDAWDSRTIAKSYASYREDHKWVASIDHRQRYYGGDLTKQTTLDANEAACREKFKGQQNVHIFKCPSSDVPDYLPVEKVDLMYIDAGHDFVSAFSDMATLQSFVSNIGVVMLNDCCFSSEGVKQNFGVLEAASKFCKLFGFTPVMCTQTDFTDTIFVKNGVRINEIFEKVLLQSDLSYVEIPSGLFWNLKVINGAKKTNLSFL